MSVSKRPPMDGLPFATKGAPPAAAPASAAPAETGETAKAKDDRVTIIIRLSEDDRATLKGIAAKDRTTIQDLMHAAVQDIIRRSR